MSNTISNWKVSGHVSNGVRKVKHSVYVTASGRGDAKDRASIMAQWVDPDQLTAVKVPADIAARAMGQPSLFLELEEKPLNTLQAHEFLTSEALTRGFEFWGISTFRSRLQNNQVPVRLVPGATGHGNRYIFDRSTLQRWLVNTWIPEQQGVPIGPRA